MTFTTLRPLFAIVESEYFVIDIRRFFFRHISSTCESNHSTCTNHQEVFLPLLRRKKVKLMNGFRFGHSHKGINVHWNPINSLPDPI